jgi:hypothetical protein
MLNFCKQTNRATRPIISHFRQQSSITSNSTTHNFARTVPEITRFLDIPAGRNGIAVIGNQSSGKTSLVEALIRRPGLFQKFDGAATKRPCRITLINTDEEVSYGRVGGTFGTKTSDMNHLSRLIADKNDGDFDKEPFDLTLWGNDLPNFVLTDYPGDVNSVKSGQNPDLRNIIAAMNASALEDPDTHKILVMNAGNDRVISNALGRIERAGELGNTTAVITKCDLVKPNKIPEILADPHYTKMGLTLYGVKLRSDEDNKAGMTIDESLQSEEDFFNGLTNFDRTQYKTGVGNVSKRMEDMIIKNALHLIPPIKAGLEAKEAKLNSALEMFETLAELEKNEENALTKQISRSVLQLVYKFGDNSPHRHIIERRIQDNMRSKIAELINNSAARPELFGNINPHAEPYAIIQNMPENGYFSGNMLQHLRAVNNNSQLKNTTDEDAKRWYETHEYGKFSVHITNEEIQQSYNAHIARQIPTAFFRFNLTEESTIRKEDWFDKQRMLIDFLLNEYNLAEELTAIATRTLHDSLYEFRPKNTDERSWQLFEYIFDEVASSTNNVGLTTTIRHTIDSIKSARVDPHRLALHVMNASYNKNSGWDKSVGVLDSEMFPREYSIYGDVWIDAALKCMADDITDRTHSIINNGLSQPLVENTINKAFKHFEKTDKTSDRLRIRKDLQKVTEYQRLVDNIEEEATLIEHRDQLASDKIRQMKEKLDQEGAAKQKRHQHHHNKSKTH